ncbi:MAG: hypothetical protein Q7J42_02800 [Sulfuritalea sp.]|nr:hypothetical protein [Sulfuritalea sp.]
MKSAAASVLARRAVDIKLDQFFGSVDGSPELSVSRYSWLTSSQMTFHHFHLRLRQLQGTFHHLPSIADGILRRGLAHRCNKSLFEHDAILSGWLMFVAGLFAKRLSVFSAIPDAHFPQSLRW